MADYIVQEDGTSKLLLEDGSGSLLLELQAASLLPFISSDASFPARLLPKTAEFNPQNLLPLQQQAVVTLKPFTTDWATKAFKLLSRQPDVPQNRLPLATTTILTPFNNDQGTKPSLGLLTKQVEQQQNLLPLVPKIVPFVPDGYSTIAPKLLGKNIEPQQNLLPLAPKLVPFIQDTPTAQLAVISSRQEQPTNLLPLQQIPAVGPFTNYDWQQPSQPLRAVHSEIAVNLLPLQQQQVALSPFLNLDFPSLAWPLPKVAIREIDQNALFLLNLPGLQPAPSPAPVESVTPGYPKRHKYRVRRLDGTIVEVFDYLEFLQITAFLIQEIAPEAVQYQGRKRGKRPQAAKATLTAEARNTLNAMLWESELLSLEDLVAQLVAIRQRSDDEFLLFYAALE